MSHLAYRLVKHAIEGQVEGRVDVTEDEREDVSSYWMTFKKREVTVN